MNWSLLSRATLETLKMVGLSTLISVILGLPLGIIVRMTQKDGLWERPLLYRLLDIVINIFRSFPFIILIIILMPLSRLIVGRMVGTTAVIVPLSIAAAPFVARMVEQSLNEVDGGLIEAALAMGSGSWDIIFRVLLPEALPSLINGLTITVINVVGYSAMAGAIGGGGLGDLAIRFGLQQLNPSMLWSSILVILILVHVIQALGNLAVRRSDHR